MGHWLCKGPFRVMGEDLSNGVSPQEIGGRTIC